MADVNPKTVIDPENDLTLYTVKKLQLQCNEMANQFEDVLKQE